MAVAAEPGHKFNPLFLVGAGGSGKTHLLHAVGNGIALARPGTVVACVSAQTFFEELVAAIHGERVDWWRRRYRGADALLLDDVQLLAGKERTQEELFHLFNAFQDAGKQLVFSATGSRRTSRASRRASCRASSRAAGRRPRAARPRMRAEMCAGSSPRRTSAPTPARWTTSPRGPPTARARWPGLVNRVVTTDRSDARDADGADGAHRARGTRAARPPAWRPRRWCPTALDPLLRSREKVVWDWPDVGDRLIEDLR